MNHERWLVQNELLFRGVNELIRDHEQGWDLRQVDFVCECGDASCTVPVTLTLAEYEQLRTHPRRFAVRPGHEIADVERVVETHVRYTVVEKYSVDAPAS